MRSSVKDCEKAFQADLQYTERKPEIIKNLLFAYALEDKTHYNAGDEYDKSLLNQAKCIIQYNVKDLKLIRNFTKLASETVDIVGADSYLSVPKMQVKAGPKVPAHCVELIRNYAGFVVNGPARPSSLYAPKRPGADTPQDVQNTAVVTPSPARPGSVPLPYQRPTKHVAVNNTPAKPTTMTPQDKPKHADKVKKRDNATPARPAESWQSDVKKQQPGAGRDPR